jgi:uncharacterized protein YbcI
MKTQASPQPTPGAAPELPRRTIRIPRSQEILDSSASVAASTVGRSPLLEISNAIVALYKEAFGRGPTKARAQFAGDDTLLVSLESSLTVAERNLVAIGEHRRLREARLLVSDALEDQFRAIVEQALGRRTLAYVSGIDTARDVTIELFTLEPAGEGAGSSAPGGGNRPQSSKGGPPCVNRIATTPPGAWTNADTSRHRPRGQNQ